MKEHSKNIAYAIFLIIISVLLSATIYAVYDILKIPSTYRVVTDVVLLLLFGTLVIEFTGRAIKIYADIEISKGVSTTLQNAFRLVGYAVLIIIFLGMLGINITGILIGAGFLGIVIGLAAQSTLSNMFSGISIMISKPFSVGDSITMLTWQYGVQPPSYPHEAFLPGFSGTVEAIGIIYSKVVGDDGLPIFIPNSILNQAMIINHHRSHKKRITVRLSFSKRIPFVEFKRAMLKRIAHSKGIDAMNPQLFVTAVTDSEYHVAIVFWTTKFNEEEQKSIVLSEAISVVNEMKTSGKRRSR